MQNKQLDMLWEVKEILSYSSIFSSKPYLDWDSLIYWVYRYLKYFDYIANILWEYLWISESVLDNYFWTLDNISDLVKSEKVKQFQEQIYSFLQQVNEKNKIDIHHLLLAGFIYSNDFVKYIDWVWLKPSEIVHRLKILEKKLEGREINLLKFLELIYITMKVLSLKNRDMFEFISGVSVDGLENDEIISRYSDNAIQDDDDIQSDIDVQEKDVNKGDKKLAIEYFWTDLTQEAKEWLLDPVIGRDKEIRQVIYTLFRKTKNNPLLIWEAGVWKTAIVEWLAQLIADWKVPDKLKNKRIFMLDMWSLVAGTKYRGEFESRLKTILQEAADPSNNIILFIDEIHTILGAGNAEWSLDAANMLKPLLSRWKIQLIWATTYDEYQKYIEKDPALKRRFQEIMVEEPTPQEAIEILKWLREKFQQYHGVNISDEAIETAVKLSVRYLMNKHLPDKAIDLIDEAAARKSTLMSKLKDDQEYKKLESKLQQVQKKIEEAIVSQDYFRAAELKKEEDKLKAKLKNYRSSNILPPQLRPTVTSEDIWNVLAEKLGIPEDKINQSEIEKLAVLEKVLKEKLLGQDEVVEKVVKAIQRNRLSVVKRSKPIASFLFLWPSWVWKTYLAKLLAKEFFWDEKALIRVDMSELMERHSVSKLIWSAPWYVWYEEWWMLTEAIRRRPYSVVLFDEIEKASPDVLNILLQILDEWYVKDNKGRIIDFKNTIIILTSNIWSEEFSKEIPKIWFITAEEKKQEDEKFEQIKERVLEKLKEMILPELLNRLDYIVVFKPLNKQILKKILKLKLKEFLDQWKEKQKEGVRLPRFSEKKLTQIVDEIYKPEFGARPIDRYIHEHIETSLIKQLLKTHLKKH